MPGPPSEPVALPPPRRRGRSSAQKSTGLDYTSCHRVDEDISSRIRSLLLSRNIRRPPRTPNSSEDCEQHSVLLGGDKEPDTRFDFSSSKSVATSAFHQFPVPRMDVASKRLLRTDGPSEDEVAAAELQPPLLQRLGLRKSSSANDVGGPSNDGAGPKDNADADNPETEVERMKFCLGLPKLVLQDQPTPDYEPVLSCGHPASANDRSGVGTNCISRTDTGVSQPFTCEGESGCSLGPGKCLRHRRQSSQPAKMPKTDHLRKSDIAAVAHVISEDVAKLGLLIKSMAGSDSSEATESGITSPVESAPVEASEPVSSKSSKPSVSSVTFKPQTPSLLSGASRGSSKHSLLKSSIKSATPVDTATPAPPILSPPPVYASGDILEPRHENKFESLAQIVSEGEEEKEENAEYWGFLPVVKDAVKEAVQEAVKRAVNEALIPAGVKKHQTNPAYRKLVGESLLKAAKDADEDLQSPPKEAETEPTQRASWQAIAPWTKGYKSISPKEVSDEQPVESKSTIEQPQSFESRGFGSYEPTEADWSEKALTSKRAISTGGDRDVEDSKSTASNKSADLKSSLKKAVPWLKELIKPEGGYEARFTKLPTRKHRDWKGHAKLPPKQDTPAIEVTKPLPVIHVPDSDMFSKTIDDLETLLTEAMLIARQTADGEDREYIPRLLCSATAVLKDGRRELEDEDTVRDASTARILSMAYAGSDHGSVEGSIHSMHESLQGSSSESELSDEEDEKQRQHLQTLPHADVAKLPSGISISTQLTQSMYPARTSAPDTSNPRKLSTKVDPVADEIINTNPFGSQPKTIRKVSTDKFSPGQTTRVATGVKTPYLETTKEDVENVETKSPPQAEVVEKRRSKNDKPAKKVSESSSSALQSTMESLNPPSIQLRESSLKLRNKAKKSSSIPAPLLTQVTIPEEDYGPAKWPRSCTESFDGNSYPSDALDFDTEKADGTVVMSGGRGNDKKEATKPKTAEQANTKRRHIDPHMFNLRGKRHVSLDEEHHRGFSLTRSHKKQTIARDWAPARKRFVATVACISTALIGILVGIYAAEVPAIQYYVVDFHHYIILGNVFFFIGLAISTFFFWPLPLLHGRKPYILGSMCLAMPLLFPQALAVGEFRSPYEAKWRVALLLPRAVMGFTLGFANMNFKATLTDLFGASLQSSNPHQEVADHHDVRRHGGGLGVWLGIWTWCTIGSIGIGFLLGASIINSSSPAWGFYISICIIAFVLLLNVVCPEVRRAAFRRSVAEVKDGKQVTRRVARGEIKMHMVQSGPKWWGEEFYHGIRLSAIMLRQPGFLVLAFYVAWIYGQIVLIIVLLGSLTSKYYNFKSPLIGASVAAIPLGALLSIPFQKAGLFSRDRTHATTTDDDTRDKRVGCSSHLIRRAIFVLCLPFAGLAYTLSSNGPPIPWILPIIFAGLIGFLSNLALSECHGIIMETFDISDLQPGMTGRPRRSKYDNQACKRTNYSSFPRVSSAFAITQSLGYCIAAAATGVGGIAQRHLGQQVATAVVAGVLLILSILLLGVLVRFREIQIIPDLHKEEMLNFMEARRRSAYLRGEVPDDDDIRPTIIGNPTHITRRMCVLEMGGMTRWSEIRRKNHLVDRDGLEAAHPNLAVMRDIERRIKHKESEIAESIRRMSAEGKLESFEMDEGGDLGAYREGAAKQKEKRAARSKSRGMTKTKTG